MLTVLRHQFVLSRGVVKDVWTGPAIVSLHICTWWHDNNNIFILYCLKNSGLNRPMNNRAFRCLTVSSTSYSIPWTRRNINYLGFGSINLSFCGQIMLCLIVFFFSLINPRSFAASMLWGDSKVSRPLLMRKQRILTNHDNISQPLEV